LVNAQALKDAHGTEPKVVPKNRKKAIEKGSRPAKFGQDEDNNLADDEQAIDNGPKGSSRLVRNGAASARNPKKFNRDWPKGAVGSGMTNSM
jgi:hypothetical protein